MRSTLLRAVGGAGDVRESCESLTAVRRPGATAVSAPAVAPRPTAAPSGAGFWRLSSSPRLGQPSGPPKRLPHRQARPPVVALVELELFGQPRVLGVPPKIQALTAQRQSAV